MNPNLLQILALVLFCFAIIHTFSTRLFERLGHRSKTHAGMWHLLGEVEIVFGFWGTVLVVLMLAIDGKAATTDYVDSLSYTEPMFVFAIMVIAASAPILDLVEQFVSFAGQLVPFSRKSASLFCTLAILPLLGSFITEPAAMTVAALTLSGKYFEHDFSTRSKYILLSVLFVNVSIGGTLTPYAAPPVLMVAGKWGWGLSHMVAHFGWKAAIVVCINAILATIVCRHELRKLPDNNTKRVRTTPGAIYIMHLVFLFGVVIFAHTPAMFMGIFLLFMGFAKAYESFQKPLMLREGLLVAFFLAGLVTLGGMQQWWLQDLLSSMSDTAVFFGAIILTSVTDNAALTYLGSLVSGVSDSFKYFLVAGAVVGGGLTVIANAPNPAGFAILRKHFPDGAIGPLSLFLYAIPPTVLALLAFLLF